MKTSQQPAGSHRTLVAARRCACLLGLLASTMAAAATVQVTHFHDIFDDTDGTCTLREAVRSANGGVNIDACSAAGAGGITDISLAAGTYRLELAGSTVDDTSLRGDLDILEPVRIRGVSADYTIIDGNVATSQERIFDVINAQLVLHQLTVTGGHEPNGNGGNIRSSPGSDLELNDTVVSDGRAHIGGGIFVGMGAQLVRSSIRNNSTVGDDGVGGGIAYLSPASDDLLLRDSVVSGNQAAAGGGIYATGVAVSLRRSKIESNIATGVGIVAGGSGAPSGSGGGLAVFGIAEFYAERVLIAGNEANRGAGIYWASDDISEITHSAIVNNTATENGGGIHVTSNIGFARYSTIAGNSALSGGGVYSASGTQFLLDAVTLAGNTGGGGLANASGAFAEFSLFADNVGGNCVESDPGSGMYNLDDEDTCGFSVNDFSQTSLINTDPLLGSLQDNGGDLPTLALLPGSPAIDAFNADERATCLTVPDQRFYARGYPPQNGGAAPSDFLCDIGAYEFTKPVMVDSTDDTVDENPADGICADVNGKCTLRAAIQQAAAEPFFNEIVLGPGTYALNIAGAGESTSNTGDLDVPYDVSITGHGQEETVIDGAQLDRIFDILLPAPNPISNRYRRNLVELRDLTLTGGSASEGGAIQSRRPLLLERVALTHNDADGDGGAVRCSDGCNLSVIDSTFHGNSAGGHGGGILHSADRELLIDGSTFSDNDAGVAGGLETTGTLRSRNSTFSGNRAGTAGAVFATRAVFENTTITDNEASFDSGALFLHAPSAIVNTLISDNRLGADKDSCAFTTTVSASVGHNLSDTDAGDCRFDQSSDLVDTDPMLGPLADNGGSTQTHTLLPGSPAIDAGDNDRCLEFDQRGFSRPVSGGGNGNCDIGAVEAAITDLSITIGTAVESLAESTRVTLTLTVTNLSDTNAVGVATRMILPPGLAFDSGTVGSNSCTSANDEVICEFGDLNSATSASVEIVTLLVSQEDVTVTVEVTSTTDENILDNNSADVVVTIDAQPSGGGSGGGGSSGGGPGGSSSGGGGAIGLLLPVFMVVALGYRFGRARELRLVVFGARSRSCRRCESSSLSNRILDQTSRDVSDST